MSQQSPGCSPACYQVSYVVAIWRMKCRGQRTATAWSSADQVFTFTSTAAKRRPSAGESSSIDLTWTGVSVVFISHLRLVTVE